MLFDTIFGKKKDAEDNVFTEKRYKDAEGKNMFKSLNFTMFTSRKNNSFEFSCIFN
jgi:hypothetical protein